MIHTKVMYLEVESGWGSFERCSAWGGGNDLPEARICLGGILVEFAWEDWGLEETVFWLVFLKAFST